MVTSYPVLSLITFLPLLGAAAILALRDRQARWIGLVTTLATFGVSLPLYAGFDKTSSALQFAISIIGVIVFTGLTAYDTQRIKDGYFEVMNDATLAGKAAIMGALSLYLDFINMFTMLLQLFGNRE